MKDISQIWFLKSPIDAEHKYYILLDFLKSINEEIKKNNVYSPTKKIFSMIKDLDHFQKNGTMDGHKELSISEEDEELLSFYRENGMEDGVKEEIRMILENSLKVLYKYADMGINLWKKMEDRIKMYNLDVPDGSQESGITIFRNMSTDEVFPYWWKKTGIKIGEEVRRGVVLKGISILNSKYSMSYEFILHETLVSLGIQDGTKFPCTIIEISEDFDKSSEIFKIAKERFIQEIDPD
jgi:hypothetical protein